jgi:hypothetical protein
MISREQLCARHCVQALIQILDEFELRESARSPLTLDESCVGLLLFWTILRGERTFLLKCLEQLPTDMWALTCDVDELLHQRSAAFDAGNWVSPQIWERHVWTWLERAQEEARTLDHYWLGTEHLLLAILAQPDSALAEVLQRHAITHDKLRDAVCAALAKRASQETPLTAEILPDGPPTTGLFDWGRPAVGVSRRFSVGMLFSVTTVYAVLLAVMRMLDLYAITIIFWLVFFTGAGLGQPILFGGTSPRRASLWLGAVLLPLEVLVLLLYLNAAGAVSNHPAKIIILTLLSIPLGAPTGYLAGCLAAGAFFLADQYNKLVENRGSSDQADETPADPLGDAPEHEPPPS